MTKTTEYVIQMQNSFNAWFDIQKYDDDGLATDSLEDMIRDLSNSNLRMVKRTIEEEVWRVKSE